MNSGAISRRYAKALLDFSCETHKEDQVYKQVKHIIRHYLRVPDLRLAIENPTVDLQTKVRLLQEATNEKEVCSELLRFFSLVLSNGREKLLLFIFYSFLDLYREAKQIHRGKLTTAVPLPEKMIHSFQEMIAAKLHGKIEFETKVNPKLLGGFILEIAFHRVDASLASQLAQVKRQFIEKNRRIV